MKDKKSKVTLRPPVYAKKSIVKSNQLNEAIFKLTVTEYRLILILISQIQDNDLDSPMIHTFSTKHIAKLLGITNTKDFYGRIRLAVEELHKKSVYIKRGDALINHSWLISSYYSENNGNFALELNPNLKPYLLNLKGEFTKYKLTVVLTLSSIHAIRLYELLKQYSSIGHRKFDSLTLRLQLGLKTTDYPKVYEFKRRVLLPAIKQINKKTELEIEIEDLKESRTVVGYKFKIKETDKVVKTIAEPKVLPLALVEELQSYGFNTKEISSLNNNYTASFLREHIDYVNKKNETKKYVSIKNAMKNRFREKKIDSTRNNVVNPPNNTETAYQKIGGALGESIEQTKLAEQEIEFKVQLEGGIENLTEKDLAIITQLSEEEPQNFDEPNYLNANAPTPLTPSPNVKALESNELDEFTNMTKKPKTRSSTLSAEIFPKLKSLGLTKAQLKHLALTYDEEHIQQNLDYTLSRHVKKPLKCPRSYFLTAVEENYYQQSLRNTESARGVLRGDVVSHLPNIPSPVQFTSTEMTFEDLPIVSDIREKSELTNVDIDVKNIEVDIKGINIDKETLNYLTEYHINKGFIESDDELQELRDEYAEKIDESLSRGVSLDAIREHQPELVDYYLSCKR